MTGLSVILCCYNSASRLRPTLEHLTLQQISSTIPWEVIIVNNNSTDETVKEATQFFQKYPQVRGCITNETKAGLSHARHKGIETAQYEYLIFCDDDNWLHPGYLQTVHQIFEHSKEVGICGGTGEGITPGSFPSWFKKKENAYAVGRPFEPGYVKYVFGAGMGLRKSVYDEALQKGFSSLLTDRKGKELSSGGDLELCYIYQFLGYKVLLSDKLMFKHFIETTRLTPDYWRRLNAGFAKTTITLRPYDLVLTKRTESPLVLWVKEYVYLAKEAARNMLHPNEDWNYLRDALKLMLLKRKDFCDNLILIRTFANKVKKK